MTPLFLSTVLVALGVVSQDRPMQQTKQSPPVKYAPLQGKVVGVLVPDAEAILAAEKRSGPAGAVLFSSGPGSYRWLYLPRPKDDRKAEDQYVVVAGDKEQVFHHVRIATRELLSEMKLPDKYALVEVEVNGGAGASAKGDSLVATSIRGVERTPEFPLDLDKVIVEVMRRTANRREAEAKAIEKVVAQAQEKVGINSPPTGPRETSDSLRVEWRPESRQFRVTVTTEVTDGYYLKGGGPGGIQAKPERTGTQFGAVGTTVYEIDTKGAFVKDTATAFEPFTRKLGLPKDARRSAIKRD